MQVPLDPEELSSLSLDPKWLPYYAGRSLLRMFIAFWSIPDLHLRVRPHRGV
ncbi:hypothetical protein ACFSQ7_25880 [Paenibacillus rhizoplanae]